MAAMSVFTNPRHRDLVEPTLFDTQDIATFHTVDWKTIAKEDFGIDVSDYDGDGSCDEHECDVTGNYADLTDRVAAWLDPQRWTVASFVADKIGVRRKESPLPKMACGNTDHMYLEEVSDSTIILQL